MGVPIFPNQSHPHNRHPVHPVPDFPFPNCYHWSCFEVMTVRVLPRPEYFEDDHAFRLPVEERIDLWSFREEDSARMMASLAQREASPLPVSDQQPIPGSPLTEPFQHPGHVSTTTPQADKGQPPSVWTVPEHSSFENVRERGSSVAPKDSNRSIRSSSMSGSQSCSITSSQLQRWNQPDPPMVANPLVDLWLELTDHVTEESIPSPEELYRERDAVAAYVIDQSVSV